MGRRRLCRRSLAALALAATLAPAPGCGGGASDGTPAGTRVVLVTLDTLRADALSAMPRLAARARSGRRFSQAFAASPATQPTHASLFTGLHPWEHGVSRNGLVLGDAYRTVAERLADAGFPTAAVVASFPLHPRFGFAQGFDVFEHRFGHDLAGPTWKGAPVAGRFYQTARPVTEDAIRLIDAATGERQFFWFHYFDPHEPYGDSAGEGMPLAVLAATRRDAPRSLAGRLHAARSLYDRDLGFLDRQLERLFGRLDDDADRFETHVVVTADHGESFGEGGALGHGGRVTREQVQVPLFVVSPRAAVDVDAAPAGSVDVGRTLLALAGVPAEGFAGRDLTRPAPGDAAAAGMRVTDLGRLDRLLAGLPADAPGGPRFFRADAEGLVAGDARAAFAEDDPARAVDAANARERFAAWAEELAAADPAEPMDEETREGLRALGYVE